MFLLLLLYSQQRLLKIKRDIIVVIVRIISVIDVPIVGVRDPATFTEENNNDGNGVGCITKRNAMEAKENEIGDRDKKATPINITQRKREHERQDRVNKMRDILQASER